CPPPWPPPPAAPAGPRRPGAPRPADPRSRPRPVVAQRFPSWLSFPGRRARERERGEAHDAAGIDVPLLVLEDAAPHRGRGVKEGVERRGPAPVQLVAALAEELPVAVGLPRGHAGQALAVLPLHVAHRALPRAHRLLVAVAPADVRQVHAEDED